MQNEAGWKYKNNCWAKSKKEKERKSITVSYNSLIMINSTTISSNVVLDKILHTFRCTR